MLGVLKSGPSGPKCLDVRQTSIRHLTMSFAVRRVRFGSALHSTIWSLDANAKSESMSLPAVTFPDSPDLLFSQLRRRTNPRISIFLPFPIRSKRQSCDRELGARVPG